MFWVDSIQPLRLGLSSFSNWCHCPFVITTIVTADSSSMLCKKRLTIEEQLWNVWQNPVSASANRSGHVRGEWVADVGNAQHLTVPCPLSELHGTWSPLPGCEGSWERYVTPKYRRNLNAGAQWIPAHVRASGCLSLNIRTEFLNFSGRVYQMILFSSRIFIKLQIIHV